MSEFLDLADRPGPDETVFAREQVAVLTHEMIVSADPLGVYVRMPGVPKRYIGCSPAEALRIGEAFTRAALRADPSLRARAVEDAAGKPMDAPHVLIGPGLELPAGDSLS